MVRHKISSSNAWMIEARFKVFKGTIF